MKFKLSDRVKVDSGKYVEFFQDMFGLISDVEIYDNRIEYLVRFYNSNVIGFNSKYIDERDLVLYEHSKS